MNNNLYAIVLTFPENITDELEYLRKKYNKSVYEIVPHITLKMPFSLSEDLSKIIDILNNISFKTKSFDIEMNGLGYFKNESNCTIYVALKNIDEATILHKQIVHSLKNCIKDIDKPRFELDKYIPHATIGESIPIKDVKHLKLELSNYNPIHKFTIKRFSLFSSKNNHKWELVKVFNLK